MKEKYFLYARKSSESDEKQVQSIDDQIKVMKQRAKSMWYNIVETFTESMSAKAPWRYKFNEMVDRLQKWEANWIIAWKLDRLTRNPIDTWTIQYMLQTWWLNNIITSDREYYPIDSWLLFSVETWMANQYILDLVKNVRRWMNSKYEKGIRPTNTPLWYLNDKNDRTIIKDSKRFKLVQKMWELMITWDYSAPKILEIANTKWGLRTRKTKNWPWKELSRASIYRIFNNIFYTWYFYYKWELIKGIHEPMISLDEFDRVQWLLWKKWSTRPKNYEYSYTWMIRCWECWNMITWELKKKYIKSKWEFKTYVYYHCTNRDKTKCSQKLIKVEYIESQILTILNWIEIIPEFKDFAINILKNSYKDELEKRTKKLDNLNNVIWKEESKLNRLTDLLLEETINSEEYKIKKISILLNIEKFKNERDKIDISWKKTIELTEKVFDFATWVKKSFLNWDLQKKKEIFSTLWQNFTLKDWKIALNIYPWFKTIRKSGTSKLIKKGSSEPIKNSTSFSKTNAILSQSNKWSEMWDSNSQPHAPKACALANCANLRFWYKKLKLLSNF